MTAERSSYDYVVIGAGSAGCVMANRLSTDPDTSVLVLEAGPPDADERIADPGGYSALFGTDRDWAYRTEPQPGLNGRELAWPRGKTLGGTSAINAMIYFRGGPEDYERWAATGCDEWGWDDVRPYFERLENAVDVDATGRGSDGPLHVTKLDAPNEVSRTFVEAAAARGYTRREHFNGAEREGVGLLEVTQRDGQRHSAADAYLKPVLDRPNLRAETGAHVTRLLFDGTRATGVRYRQAGRRHEVGVEREVVCCAGAVNSPQLLMVSGIGPADHLRDHDVPVVVDRPGVGRNLRDHLLCWVNYEAAHPTDVHTDPDARARSEAAVVLGSSESVETPDLLLSAAPGYRDAPAQPRPDGDVFAVAVALLRPESTGTLELASSDPLADPVIDPAYLSASGDLSRLVDGLGRLREVTAAGPFDDLRGKEYTPWSGEPTDAELEAYLRANLGTFWHPVGTCAMGSDEPAVVDQQCRVRGVGGLRVVDASVVPTVVTAATNAPTTMVAEKTAAAMTGDVPGAKGGR